MLIALQYGHPRIAIELLEWSGDSDAAHVNKATPHDGSNPLLVATLYKYAEVGQSMIQKATICSISPLIFFCVYDRLCRS